MQAARADILLLLVLQFVCILLSFALVAVDLYIAGRSLVALRAAELLSLAAELKRRTGLRPSLVAEGRFVAVAKFASAADTSAFDGVRFDNEPKSFLESLRSRDYLSFADSGAIFSGVK